MPKKYDYKGNAVTGSATDEVSPYSVVGLSGTDDVNKYASVTVGIDNLFDKRHYRQGNAQTTGNANTHSYLSVWRGCEHLQLVRLHLLRQPEYPRLIS
nr:Enterobactin outer-membrane receptor [Candidatus Pantoea persica]